VTTPDPQRATTPGTTPSASPAGSTPTAPATQSSPPVVSPPAAAAARQSRSHRRGRGIGLGLAAALLVFVTVILVLFVLFNTQTVDISLVFGDVQAPLVLALVIAAVLGGLVVAMAGLALRARRKN
jgi:uncharacterized integral membrane protein